MFRRKSKRSGRSVYSAPTISGRSRLSVNSNHSHGDNSLGGGIKIKTIVFRTTSSSGSSSGVKQYHHQHHHHQAGSPTASTRSCISITSPTTTNKKRTSGAKTVTFGKLHIREYARTIGDNPSCSSGPPVGISWEHTSTISVSLDAYESVRPLRRTHFEMVLPRTVREYMLRREWEIPQSQIAAAVRANNRTKNQRRSTVQGLSSYTFGSSARRAATAGPDRGESSPSLGKTGKKLFRSVLGRKSVNEQVAILQRQAERASASNGSSNNSVSEVGSLLLPSPSSSSLRSADDNGTTKVMGSTVGTTKTPSSLVGGNTASTTGSASTLRAKGTKAESSKSLISARSRSSNKERHNKETSNHSRSSYRHEKKADSSIHSRSSYKQGTNSERTRGSRLSSVVQEEKNHDDTSSHSSQESASANERNETEAVSLGCRRRTAAKERVASHSSSPHPRVVKNKTLATRTTVSNDEPHNRSSAPVIENTEESSSEPELVEYFV